jgi:putative ABC transport system substrate-binding protein
MMTGAQAARGDPAEFFIGAMKEIGYVDRRNVFIDGRAAGVSDDQLPRRAAELVHRNVDIIVAGGSSAAVVAAKNAARAIPIVMAVSDDAMENGFVQSLGKPGGNIAGLTVPYAELLWTQVELLKEIAPTIARVAVFWNPANSTHVAVVKRLGAPPHR